jgi:hypothetical protein
MMAAMLVTRPDARQLGLVAVRSRAELGVVRVADAPLAVAWVVIGAAMLLGCGRLGFDGPGDARPGGVTDDAALDGASSTYVALVLADRPLGYWRLGDRTTTAVDASGHGLAGLYGGGFTQGISGALMDDPDTAVQFDGVNGEITVGPVLDFAGTTAFSIEVWIKPLVTDGAFRHVFTKQDRSAPKQGYAMLVHPPDGLVFERFVDGTGMFAMFPVVFDTDFHHVVATYDGSAMRLYIDGMQSSQAADARPMPSISNPALIGASSDSSTYFDGVIDEVAVYPAALPAARVQAHLAASHRNQTSSR